MSTVLLGNWIEWHSATSSRRISTVLVTAGVAIPEWRRYPVICYLQTKRIIFFSDSKAWSRTVCRVLLVRDNERRTVCEGAQSVIDEKSWSRRHSTLPVSCLSRHVSLYQESSVLSRWFVPRTDTSALSSSSVSSRFPKPIMLIVTCSHSYFSDSLLLLFDAIVLKPLCPNKHLLYAAILRRWLFSAICIATLIVRDYVVIFVCFAVVKII